MAKASKKATPPRPVAPLLSKHARWIVAGLLLLFATMAWSAVSQKSTTFDEIAHMTAGTAYWKTGDYRLHPENGILPQRIVALPLLAMGAEFPDTNQEWWWKSDVWKLGYQFFYTLGNDADRMLWWSRGTMVGLGVVLGWIVYYWSSRLFGAAGGLVSLAAYVFCPNLLAHSALASSDLAAALMFVASLGCFWRVLHRVSIATVAGSAVVMGLLFVTKMSAVLILPVALVLTAIRLAAGRPLVVEWRGRRFVRRRWPQAGILAGVLFVHAITAFATIWLFFGLRFATFRESQPGRDSMFRDYTIDSLTDNGPIGSFVDFVHRNHLLPEPYLHGFAFVNEFSKARRAYFRGEVRATGWRIYFPYAFLVKTPLPTLGLMAAAACAALASWTAVRGSPDRFSTMIRRRKDRGVYRTAPLWVFLIVYWAVAINSNLNIGHRHILPTYPPMLILGGAAGYWLVGRRKLPRVIVGVLLVFLVLDSTSVYPHYLAYFNQTIGGPRNGYRHFVDSSLDWGQDLPGLRRWLVVNQDPAWRGKPVFLAYFGTGSPRYYQINAELLPGYTGWDRRGEFLVLEPGTYCISATMLSCVYTPQWKPWNEKYEKQYQEGRRAVATLYERQRREPGSFEAMMRDPARAEEARAWNGLLNQFNELRFARLCAYLRRREPDDAIGHSILIYHLDASDLNAALHEPYQDWK